jgi:hypothetical protein
MNGVIGYHTTTKACSSAAIWSTDIKMSKGYSLLKVLLIYSKTNLFSCPITTFSFIRFFIYFIGRAASLNRSWDIRDMLVAWFQERVSFRGF